MNRISLRLCVLLLLVACRETTAPESQQLQLSVLAGDVQFGLPGTELAEPLQVLVVDAAAKKPVKDVTVQWQVSTGSGTVTPTTDMTDDRGIAATRLSLGTQLGTYRVQATVARLVGSVPSFTAEAVLRPEIQSISPAGAAAGQTVVITGSNFHARAEYNGVRFDGIRGTVLSATTTRLEVVVPGCVPTRTVNVDVLVGQVASASMPFAAVGTSGSALAIQPGQAIFLSDPAQVACFRLPGGIPNARYLLLPQNATTHYPGEMPFVLGSYPGVAPAPVVTAAAPGALSNAEAFELRLRTRERAWVAAAAELRAATSGLAAQVAEPQVGDQRTFKVLNSDDKSVSVTAEVVAVSARAILYQDLAAPDGGFTATEFGHFGELLDDPIYDTDVQVFGAPSDIDGNGRIIILFTPRVNALTGRGDASFIAGYFYGCDLVDRSRCTDSNRGEIFYSLVPDPQGKFSDARTSSTVLRAVQPVLAHELQHMINFSARNQSLDALWLSEGLAHTAEDVVGDVFAQRGDAITAREFQRTNYARASRFLSGIDTVSLIAEDSPGTIAMRGGAFLFLRYLRAHYGGNELLRKLTRTQLSSTANVTAQTGQAWSQLLGDFGIALYNSSLATLPVQPLDAHHTFGDLPVRAGMLSEVGTFPLKLGVVPFSDGAASGRLPAGASGLFVLAAPVTSTYPPPSLVFAGALGGPFATGAAPQLVIYRTR